jgi:nitrogen regulatory protein PII 2
MKEIIVVIRPRKWNETLEKLSAAGFDAFTRQRAYGRGKQMGLRYQTEQGETGERITFLPKWMVTLVVEDEKADQAIEILQKANQTGEIGDGRIFVCPLGDAVRIRTNENGPLAIQ